MRAFLSSLVTGFAGFRDAAAMGVRALGHDPVRADDFGTLRVSPWHRTLREIAPR